ncbi:hypothetical protein DSO57_1011255 [Entomophthora muscae]|uniref:Uncharacterized protein n=1 Tax=Entomophthora muscae TaxID=34485 RepID=A0ACC2RX76_9FUNG|nr:hypothetical protein DSO57_1011255 [Entomophthora muscae]
MLGKEKASWLDPKEEKGPEKNPKLGERLSDPGSTKILLILSGKEEKVFLTLGLYKTGRKSFLLSLFEASHQ